ncbi:acetyl-CoA carboxylase, biotin carboxyl carrier protein [Chloroherpeton thalassium ATCC 35110]|uniref:Biotin carboxyl carrier protein of acetyl-CoA carboxylase n=1 Tax=Chloroherpeton thalassium (strain ATCC 35110 / GB-78) TaxID=517418 RepID=B3QW62_CHLT3|nr:acetyl-CoA carboxylase biotin carboxyl carrier protein [Chloroherpeton thalassium]ACF13175.1 acetyl-CoA carboxylase, biotin carboxyl carrier protein [Chloroherpeton thalassium ATCC 35110]
MNLDDIQKLIKLLDESSLDELKIEEGEFKLTLKRSKETAAVGQSFHHVTAPPSYYPSTHAMAAPQMQPAQPQPTAEQTAPTGGSAAQADTNSQAAKYKEIRSPMVGTFYRAPSPESSPYIQVGDSINPGKVLCIIEAMKLMNEIESDIQGKIVKILVENGQPVEYDQVLFLVEPA